MPQTNPDATESAIPVLSRLGIIVVTFSTMLASLMQTLDTTIANVALPYMQGSMSASQEEINWVLTSYIVAAAIMTAPTGFLAARFGRTRLFIISVVGFTVASILCGAAQSLDQVVIFRVLQGMFGAALVPLSQAVLFDIYPVERRGSTMALWSMIVTIGPILGPILGGWLTEDYSWRWVFYINVPFGVLTVAGLLIFLKETPRSKTIKLDWIGFGALSLAIGAFQTMLDRGETLDWFGSAEIITEAFVAGLGFYIFIVQSLLAPTPFLSLKLFTDWNFTIGIILMFIVGLILYATIALLAPYLQDLLNYPVITAGIALAPRGAGNMLGAIICGRLMGRVSARLLIGLGFVIGSYALYAMTSWTPDISEWSIINTGFIQGISIGFIFSPVATMAFATVPSELRTEATGIFNLMRNLGSAIGISVTSALLQTNTQINHALIIGNITPFNRVFQTGAASRFWNPVSPQGAVALNEEITRQASIIGYIDNFKLMLILSIMALPLVLLIRPSPSVVLKSEPILE